MSDTQKHTKPNVPNLRFPGFEGEWEIKKLSAFLSENKERNRNGEFRKTDVLSVSGDCGIVNQIELLGRSFAGKSVADYHIVRTGDIVYTKSPLKEYPYGIVKYNNGKDGIVSTLYAVYHHNDNVDGEFVEYYFTNPHRTNKYFKPIVRIGAKHDMKIGNEEVLDNFVIFPDLTEQRKITEILSLLDERIIIQNKVIEKYESLIKALCHNLIISSNGTVCHIGDILKIGSGKDYKHLTAGSVPVFGTGGYMLSVSDWLYEGESVCIGRKGTINNPFYVDGKFWTVDTLFYTYDFEGVLPKYCYYLFQTIDWLQYNEASGVPSLSKSTIERIRISIPSIDEQAKAVQVLARVEMAITCWRELLNHYESIKQYLLSQLFI